MRNAFVSVYRFYRDGFAEMRLGKVLWLVILIKLFIIFIILRLFFLPNTLNEKAANGDIAEYVSSQLVERSHENTR